MQICQVEVFSHGVKITGIEVSAMQVLREYALQLVQYKVEKVRQRFIRTAERVFAAATADRGEWRFHRHELPNLLEAFKSRGYLEGQHLKVIYVPDHPIAKIDVSMPKGWAPREEQLPIIEYGLADGRTKVITMQTGTGKTATSLKIVSLIGHRLMVTVLGRYLEKWKSDLIENYGLKPQELVVVRGQKQLHALLEAAHLGQLPTQLAAVLITTDTMVDYIDLYEKTKFVAMPKYLVPPERIYEVLSVGIRIIDECHQNFHANFKMDLYTHIDKGIYLSATLESDNQFIDKMYRIAYPMHLRMDGGKYQQYCNVVNVEYQLEDSRKVRFKNAKGQYSQNDYESWIMKDPGRLKNYLELIWNIAKVEYLSDYVEGQRLLILAGRTEMCSVIANYIDGRLADHTVSKYTSAEDYDVLMNSDVSVSTYGSAGTAVDIADLTTCICTIAMSASQGNLQILGRLRKLKRWPHRNPKFIYLTCLDVPPHRTYHEKKLALFKGKALSHTSMTSRFRV